MISSRAASYYLPAVVGGGVFVALVLVVVGGGFDLGVALASFWRGSIGSSYALLSATLVRSPPLILAGLAVTIAFRAGVINIGAEGQLLAGAAATTAIGLSLAGSPSTVTLFAELAAGVAGGTAWAGVAALLKRRFHVLEVISTLMLNFVAIQGVAYLVRGPLQEPTRAFPQTSMLVPAARLPTLLPGHRLHVGLVGAVGMALALWWLLGSTAIGFRVRVVGASPAAGACSGGLNVQRVQFCAFLASGALAGLGGAVLVTGQTFGLFEDISAGIGYTAIAVALLARLSPVAVVGTGIFFGALETGAAAMQRDAGIPSVFVSLLEALLVLGVLIIDYSRGASRVPAPKVE